VAGIGLLALYALVHGAVFGAVADRFLRLRTLPETIGAGLAWGFVSWMFFWYTLLPIARGGAPFRLTVTSNMFVAPTWVFLVGFSMLGIVTSLTYWILHREGIVGTRTCGARGSPVGTAGACASQRKSVRTRSGRALLPDQGLPGTTESAALPPGDQWRRKRR
jgi:membrane associated rhomboid family serine protease